MDNDDTDCRFTFAHYYDIISKALGLGYTILSCYDYFKCRQEKKLPEKYVILRHDIEHYPDRAVRFAEIESEHGVTATYFIRVHAKKYNLFNFKTYNDLRRIIELSHELGLHAEPCDFASTSKENIQDVFKKELKVLNLILDYQVKGVCPHVDWTEYNNLDFFQANDIKDYGLDYQAYDKTFFEDNFYISDGQHYYWKNYDHGKLLEQQSCPCVVFEKEVPNIYLLTHPLNWFEKEFHLEYY